MGKFILFIIMNFYMAFGFASNTLRELEYAEEIEASLLKGDIVWLNTKGEQFLGLYTETEGITNSGSVIILHSIDGHPNQEKLIKPLRQFLPDHNWATFSIQMPVLGIGAKEYEYYPLFDDAKLRIQATIDYLLKGGVNNIVIIGYGLGAMMAVYYLKEAAMGHRVKALVTISLPATASEYEQAQVTHFMSKIDIPFLDVFTEYDLASITGTARQRRIAAKDNKAYRQFKIAGEGYLFQHDEGLLVKRIYSWINRTFKSISLSN